MPSLGAKSLIRANLELWINDTLLRQGFYSNVNTGDVDNYNNNISRLNLVIGDPDFTDGRVWQSAFKNWVYESGIPSAHTGVAPPFIASGVSVNGTFYPEVTTVGAFAHFIDFPNGRVIFDSPQASSDVVEGAFSYKHVTVDFADTLNNENKPLLIETMLKDNPPQTGVQTYPDVTSRTLPAIWIDILSRTSRGYELGTRKPIKEYRGVFHLWARDNFELDFLEDILGDEQRAVLIGVDFNTAPFPLLAFGRRNSLWTQYSDYATLWGPYTWRRIYLDETNPIKDAPLFEIERSRVNFLIRTYPNF